MCKNYMVYVIRKLYISYILTQKVLELSKFARIAKIFVWQLQLQERLTKKLTMAIYKILQHWRALIYV
jgi:GTP cyclohydrolase I